MATILAVDDSVLILTAIQEIFYGSGHRILTLSDPEKAREAFERNKPDLVLLDFYMGKISGVEIYGHIRALSANTPVIFLSGTSPVLLDSLIPPTPLVRFLEKPIDAELLKAAVKEYLGDAPQTSVPQMPQLRQARRLNADEMFPGRCPTPLPG